MDISMRMAGIDVGIQLLICVTMAQAVVIDLTGTWTVINRNKGISIQGSVPGSMYTAMHASGKISDPRFRDNDVKLRWIALDDWTYTRSFQISPEMLKSGSILLVCDGLNTVSTVYINNITVGTSDNMFLQYVFDITHAIKEGENEIRIDFESPVRVVQERYEASAYEIPNQCINISYGECHVNFLRTAAYSFSWDGGPCFPLQGVWQPIYIEAFDTAVIRQVALLVQKDLQGGWTIDVTVTFDLSGSSASGTLVMNMVEVPVSASKPLTLTPDTTTVRHSLTVPSTMAVDRWWPRGYGDQTLYSVNVTFYDRGSTHCTSRQHKIGFRTVELVQDPVGDNQGLTFYYKINHVPVYLKGTSLMPIDNFPENVTREKYERIFTSVVEANMNTLRLHGHGFYENEVFYELADEYGIMVWQDLMFSLALYPTTPQFLDSVTKELTYQARRLVRHPSIIQWCGNNEIEEALTHFWFGIKKDMFARYSKDYVKLFVDTLMVTLRTEDPSRPYVTAIPSNGAAEKAHGYLSANPQDEHYGDIHYYNYTADMWSVASYKIPRMATEYGLQAWSGVEDLETAFLPTDFDYWGEMAVHRQHHWTGSEEMMDEIVQHFKKPTSTDKARLFKDIIYLTQIGQAVGIQGESEHFRRWQNQVTSDGRGYTMGSLYWQLHSEWQAPDWSSIDYNMKWRMLHYYAKKFFATTIASPYFEHGNLNIYMVVDEVNVKVSQMRTGTYQFVPDVDGEPRHLSVKTRRAVSGVLYIQMYRWDEFTPLATWLYTYNLTSTSQLVFSRSVSSLVSESKCPGKSSCFLYIYANDPDSGVNANLPLTYYKDTQGLQKADIKITDVIQITDRIFNVKMSTNQIAPFVWLDAYRIPGRFSDNGFLMFRQTWNVNFTSWDPVDMTSLKKSLTVKSLMDVY